jgi:polysaccharide biosynthesis/export protein
MKATHLVQAFSLSLTLMSCTSGPKFDPRENPSVVDPSFTSGSSSKPLPAEYLKEPKTAYKLGPGDKLDIEIMGEEGSRAETFVTPDSKVYFNLLPGIDVAGITTQQLKEQLEVKLVQYYKHPQVSVNLVEGTSQRVWVLGRVNQPGIYPLTRPLRVLDAVSLAGGLFTSRFTGTTEELADLEHSFLIRKGSMIPVNFKKLIHEGDMTQNIYLQPNDFIYLPSALTNEVYVLGAVMEPRPVGFMSDMNLLAALSKGLGMRPDADLTHVSIIRGSLTDPKVAVVNALSVIKGQATNFRLQPGDIVYVPGAGSISPSNLGREAVNTFVRIVSANEGGNAAIGSGGPGVGVNVNIGGNN